MNMFLWTVEWNPEAVSSVCERAKHKTALTSCKRNSDQRWWCFWHVSKQKPISLQFNYKLEHEWSEYSYLPKKKTHKFNFHHVCQKLNVFDGRFFLCVVLETWCWSSETQNKLQYMWVGRDKENVINIIVVNVVIMFLMFTLSSPNYSNCPWVSKEEWCSSCLMCM